MYCTAALLEAYVVIGSWWCLRYQTCLQSITAALRSWRLEIKPLIYATDNIFMSAACMVVQSVPCTSFIWTMYRTSSVASVMTCKLTGWWNNGWLEEGTQNVQKSGTIILTVWVKKTSIRKATDDDRLQGIYKLSNRLLLVPQCKRIAPWVFWSTSWYRFRVPRVFELFLFIHPPPLMLNGS